LTLQSGIVGSDRVLDSHGIGEIWNVLHDLVERRNVARLTVERNACSCHCNTRRNKLDRIPERRRDIALNNYLPVCPGERADTNPVQYGLPALRNRQPRWSY